MSAESILADLVAFPSLPATPNGEIAAYVRDRLARHGVEARLLPGPEGDRVNLFATIGPRDVPGYVLSGHMDVVPVEGQSWTSDPFCLRTEGGKLIARGATDMKGFLACVLAMVPEFVAARPSRPIHVAFSYDEEIGCRGVGHMLARLPELCAPPLGAIIGEPSDMAPVLSHKGKQAIEVAIEGVAGHSSNPDLGLNALYPAAELLLFIRDLEDRLKREGPFDARFTPPHSTIQAGVIRGGSAVNIIPDRVAIGLEVRSIPAQAPQDVTAEITARLDTLASERGVRVSRRELSSYPALPPSEGADLARLVERLSGRAAVQTVSYGTEAGLFHAAGVPALICGPGSITRAHKADEFILRSELGDCCRMLRGLAAEVG